MPLTKKGRKIMRTMPKTYRSAAKAKRVFDTSRNAGRIRGVDRTRRRRR